MASSGLHLFLCVCVTVDSYRQVWGFSSDLFSKAIHGFPILLLQVQVFVLTVCVYFSPESFFFPTVFLCSPHDIFLHLS